MNTEPLHILATPPPKAFGVAGTVVLTVVERRTGRRTHVRRTPEGVLWVDDPNADQGKLKRWIREGRPIVRV